MTHRSAWAARLRGLILGTAIAAGLAACEDEARRGAEDLQTIAARDTLRAVAPFNSTSYFIYRGEEMGYEYELLEAFAGDKGLVLHVTPVRDPDSLFALLERGVGDVAMGRLVPRANADPDVSFTAPVYHTRASVVQRVPGAPLPALPESALGGSPPAPAAGPVPLRAKLIESPEELAGHRVVVPDGTPYRVWLMELADSLSGDIEVVVAQGDATVEQMLRRVAAGEVELTVAPQNVAKLSAAYYTNLLVAPNVGPPYPVAWAVRDESQELHEALDEWLRAPERAALMDSLYRRYFVDRRGYRERVASGFLEQERQRISPWDSLFKRHAPRVGWDWRLLASQAFQESRFDPRARSWAGALGLLQLMPGTARQFGAPNPRDPVQNVTAAVRYIEWLQRFWASRIQDPQERLKFVLASYNTGPGHVQDAQRLAAKYGDDPTRWDHVAYWLLQKSKRQYYTDPVVRYGFSRGIEPVTYVDIVLERFRNYSKFLAS